MEVDNDDVLVTSPTQQDFDILSAPLKAWKIKIQKLSKEDPINATIYRTERMPIISESPNEAIDAPMRFQHVMTAACQQEQMANVNVDI